MKYKSIFSIVAVAAVSAFFSIGCGDNGGGNKPNNPITPPDTTGGGGIVGDLPEIFAIDISQESDEWNYLVAANDGSSMFIDVDEATDMPARVFIKPDKNSDEGISIFFKENGLPDKLVADGHILYYGNFNGYKYDLAIIYPDSRIEYHFGVESDVNWDDYGDVSGLGKAQLLSKVQFFNLSGLSKTLGIVNHAVGLGMCGVSVFFPNTVTGGMCASYVVGELSHLAVDLAGKVFDGFPTDMGHLALDIFDCANLYFGDAWTSMLEMLGSAGAVDACLSTFTGTISILTNQDYSLTEQKSTQVNEASGTISGGGTVNTYIVEFSANGGSGAPNRRTVNAGSNITLPEQGYLTRSGYNFDGWNTNYSGTGTNYSEGSSYMPTGNTTLYAKWNAITRTVTFDANGGTVSPASAKTGADGRLASLPTPAKNGFTFIGWYTALSGGTKVTTNTTFIANTTIYARWEDTYIGKGNNINNYRTVKIGTQTWMAENLDYNVPNDTTDRCYDDSPDSCAKYGRLYSWNAAMKACPAGWRLPSDDDWDVLINYADNYGNRLNAKGGWEGGWEEENCTIVGTYYGDDEDQFCSTDDYGFSALPGGYGIIDSYSYGCRSAGESGVAWSSTENGANYAFARPFGLLMVGGISYGKSLMCSVRCLRE